MKRIQRFKDRLIRSRGGILYVKRLLKTKREKKELFNEIKRERERGHSTLSHIASAKKLSLVLGSRAYIHDLEIPVLSKYAGLSQETLVEIGAAFGASALLLCANASESLQIHSIDPFIKDSMGNFAATEKRCHDNVVHGLTLLGMKERAKRWHIHPVPSYDLIKTWTGPIGFLYIDGDHTYEAVKKDFDDWFPFVISGGYILFHDSRKEPGTPIETFNRGWHGPTKLAEELKSRNDLSLVEEAASLTIWQKK